MPLCTAWLLSPYSISLPCVCASFAPLQSLAECRSTSLVFRHLMMNSHSGCNGCKRNYHTRSSRYFSKRRDSDSASAECLEDKTPWNLSRFIIRAMDEDISSEHVNPNTAWKKCLLTLNVLYRQCGLLMDSQELQLGTKMLSIFAAVLVLQGGAVAMASMITTRDANDILGVDITSGFASALLLIFFSELGDKTFFIAALLAMRKSNVAVFTGTFGALVAMTFISVVLGRTFHYIDGVLPFSLGDNEIPLDDLAAVALLVYFGISSIIEAESMKGSKAKEEQEEQNGAISHFSPL